MGWLGVAIVARARQQILRFTIDRSKHALILCMSLALHGSHPVSAGELGLDALAHSRCAGGIH